MRKRYGPYFAQVTGEEAELNCRTGMRFTARLLTMVEEGDFARVKAGGVFHSASLFYLFSSGPIQKRPNDQNVVRN